MPGSTVCVRSDRPRGLTLIEILVTLAVIAVLSALIFPVFARAREKSHQASCLSNLHQLALAFAQYSADYDSANPTGLTAPGLFSKRYPTNMGWGGKIYPYGKNSAIFHCPSDAHREAQVWFGGQQAYPLSYALNSNLALAAQIAMLTAPARTILLFEVTGGNAEITDPAEGQEARVNPTRISASGNGTSGSIFDVTRIPSETSHQGRLTLYATGFLDNYEGFDGSDDYQGQPPRHSDGANFLCADGHVKWQSGKQVSAGITALHPTDAQAHQGCRYIYTSPQHSVFPCAEGASGGQHALTFSPN